MRRPFPLVFATLAAMAVLLAACGGGGEASGGATAGASADQGETSDLTPVTVGVMPIVDTAAIWLGVEQGIFEEHGLDVELEQAQGGAAIIPAVVSGEYDFGFSNIVSLFVAADQGLPLKLLAPANATSGDPDADISAVVVPEDSDITSVEDLEGKTVAVNTLKNIGDVTVSHVVAEAGGDPETIQFVEMGFPDMPAALANGQVDAAWVLEPFLTIAKRQGARVVSANFVETDPDLLIAGYFTTAQKVQSDPEMVEAFTAAITESLRYADENPDDARAILSTYTEIEPAVQEAMAMPRFPSELDRDALQLLADLSLEYGLVENPVDLESLLDLEGLPQ